MKATYKIKGEIYIFEQKVVNGESGISVRNNNWVTEESFTSRRTELPESSIDAVRILNKEGLNWIDIK